MGFYNKIQYKKRRNTLNMFINCSLVNIYGAFKFYDYKTNYWTFFAITTSHRYNQTTNIFTWRYPWILCYILVLIMRQCFFRLRSILKYLDKMRKKSQEMNKQPEYVIHHKGSACEKETKNRLNGRERMAKMKRNNKWKWKDYDDDIISHGRTL